MALPDAISRALRNAEKLKASGSGNEANTKALLIEPMLDALGWDPVDLDVVEREVKVYEGTFLDYALKLGGVARVYVEAKGFGENLDDKRFIAQTVNYANNDGVVWCVLTNGLRWRIYKTNESSPMDRKLLFEVDLVDESETVGEKAKLLGLVGREAVDAGELDAFGDRVFTDGRIRKVLADLAAQPPQPLLDAITVGLGHPPVPLDALKRSLGRIFDVSPSGIKTPPPGGRRSSHAAIGPPAPPKGQEYDLDHHVGNKSALINELFNEVNRFGMALGGDVTRRIRKYYVGYFRGKTSFFTVELQQRRVLVYLSLDPALLRPWNDEAMRDASQIGHFGMGDTEYSLTTSDQLADVQELIQLAYHQRG